MIPIKGTKYEKFWTGCESSQCDCEGNDAAYLIEEDGEVIAICEEGASLL